MSTQLAQAANTAVTAPTVHPVAQAMEIIRNPRFAVSQRAAGLATMIDYYASDLMAILPPHVKLEHLKQMFVLQVKQIPKLLECDPVSLMKAVYTAASLGLEPDPYLGQLYLIPFKSQVQVIPGYRGLLRLVRNSNEIASIQATPVFESDEFNLDLFNPANCRHLPGTVGTRTDDRIVAFYAVARFKDEGAEPQIEYMSREQVEAVRNDSANYKMARDKADTVWGKHFGEMGRKTVLRRLIKQLPISVTRELAQAQALDNIAHQGHAGYVDTSTGEVIDIFSQGDVETEEPGNQPAPAGATASRLDAFAETPAKGTRPQTTLPLGEAVQS